ncbi:MAG: nucleotidyltransferase family protein [Fibrobacter sp.]|nr:nucleotidyltransferase family protein [Fibrobacter sp.]
MSAEQWKQIFALSKKQALMGVIYSGVQRLPANLQPPKELMDRWNQLVRQIVIRNNRMNATAAKVTRMFAERGASTVILKGQANALLYPEPLLRQAGDIDILVQGGRDSVLNHLKEMHLMENFTREEVSNLHAHLDAKFFDGITVEVHFIPTCNHSPITTRNMLRYFDRELAKPAAVPSSVQPGAQSNGFNAPPLTFALMMQLSHMQRHFIDSGLGLRQVMDYYHLLRNSTQADRECTAASLRACGLYNMARATMWVLAELFKLPAGLMLCAPDERRGRKLLKVILADGNFGQYSSNNYSVPLVRHWLTNAGRYLDRITFDIGESLWGELRFVTRFVTSIPYRIKTRRFTLRR